MGTGFLMKMAVHVAKKENALFTYPVAKQERYVAHFPEPKDGIERGYFQYRCQMKMHGFFTRMLVNLAALPLSWYYSFKFTTKEEGKDQLADAVFFNDGKPFNIVPDTLLQEYENILMLPADDRCLTKSDKKFLKKIFRKYPFSWMLRLKLIIKVAQYSFAITKHNPKAIISCSEYSFTSPIMTEYCHTRGVKLINVMHGEKLYVMRDSFAKYDAFYVWGQEYADLLSELRADKEQFCIEVPQSMRINRQPNTEIKYDYTYYLAVENAEALKKISDALRKLQESGKRISVRPHPRYSDIKLVSELFAFANIEDVKTVTIEESLLQTGAAISMFSTVLNQAQCNAVPIVIDDISNPAHFEKLKELKYVCLGKEHTLLSQIAR